MRLAKASTKAIRYACLKYHYAKAVPQIRLGYSVFNDADEWCGVVLFSNGANPRIAQEYDLVQGQVVELVRMALNGKQEFTSQVLAAALRTIKKDAPQVKVIVSYADRNQEHIGTIYQATNFFYMDERSNERGIRINGKLTHRRSVGKKYGNASIQWLRKNIDPNAEIVRGKTKIKYVYPLDRKQRKKLKKMAKPYPKKQSA
ncbi:Mom family adenine methylcarbamoylation protein [Psychroflexus aestuariivivens]|uniref:Mom family adenine methylcarbamoylation protein n=1 Tax=Psychroflexus aestuariivivens TaxID=1795040 RepID=UPI000FDA95A5|nr:protein Mom [Psychroflexus aestuariivivens]